MLCERLPWSVQALADSRAINPALFVTLANAVSPDSLGPGVNVVKQPRTVVERNLAESESPLDYVCVGAKDLAALFRKMAVQQALGGCEESEVNRCWCLRLN